jgi:hypothetical protein
MRRHADCPVENMILLMALSLATAIPAPSPSVPGYMDRRHLAPLCDPSSVDVGEARSLCLGYIVGSVDQLLAQQSRRPASRRSICLPMGLPIETLRDAVTRRLVQRPVARQVAAASLIRDALEAAFPCPAPTVAAPLP